MGQTQPDQPSPSPIRTSAAQYQRRRQKAADAFIVARWLPTLPYLDEWEPYDLAQLTSAAAVVEPAEREREREVTITRPPRRRRLSLLRYFSHTATSVPVLVPAGPVEPVLPSDSPPSYDSLSRQASRESNSLSVQRTRLEVPDEQRVVDWLSAAIVTEDGLAAAEATSSGDSRPRRVHRAASAASADSGYASLYPARSRTETIARESGSSPERAGSEPRAEHEAKRRFWSFGKKKNGTGTFIPLHVADSDVTDYMSTTVHSEGASEVVARIEGT